MNLEIDIHMEMNKNYSYMTLEEYNKRIKDDEPVIRSCWNCNSAHNHLKKADYLIYCVWCGKLYYKGKPLKVIKDETN